MRLAPPRGRCGGVILVAHGLQLADSRIDRSPVHPQHSRHIRETAKADLQRLDRGVAASLLFRQRTQVDMLVPGYGHEQGILVDAARACVCIPARRQALTGLLRKLRYPRLCPPIVRR